jgi:hypothetical protein
MTHKERLDKLKEQTGMSHREIVKWAVNELYARGPYQPVGLTLRAMIIRDLKSRGSNLPLWAQQKGLKMGSVEHIIQQIDKGAKEGDLISPVAKEVGAALYREWPLLLEERGWC